MHFVENQKGIVGNQCRVDRTSSRRATVSSEQKSRANLIHRRTADGRLDWCAGPCVIAKLASTKGGCEKWAILFRARER